MIAGGMYIHVPFCVRKCKYCNFYSTELTQENLNIYLEGLKKEISHYKNKDYEVKTIYFGGGTPSLLGLKHLEFIFNHLDKSFNLSKLKEVTLEANPESVSMNKVIGWKELGFNRISLGIQSFNNKSLTLLGRAHTANQAEEALKILVKSFSNVSADLICGLPNQTLNDWEDEINHILEYDLNHISIYPLQIESDTPLSKIVKDDYYNKIDQIMHDMMYLTKDKLEIENYRHYEIANYAKDSFESKHNLIYWTYKPYLGLGPSAASFYNGVRWQNTTDLKVWKKTLKKEIDYDSQRLDIKMAEFVFLALRLINKGLDSNKFYEEFNVTLEKIYGETLDKLINYKWLTKDKNQYKLTSQAIFFANEVFAEFLPDAN